MSLSIVSAGCLGLLLRQRETPLLQPYLVVRSRSPASPASASRESARRCDLRRLAQSSADLLNNKPCHSRLRFFAMLRRLSSQPSRCVINSIARAGSCFCIHASRTQCLYTQAVSLRQRFATQRFENTSAASASPRYSENAAEFVFQIGDNGPAVGCGTPENALRARACRRRRATVRLRVTSGGHVLHHGVRCQPDVFARGIIVLAIRCEPLGAIFARTAKPVCRLFRMHPERASRPARDNACQ